MKEFDIYLFDFDGTLADSRDSLFLVYEKAFSQVGLTVTKTEVETYMKETIDVSFKRKTSDLSKLKEFMDSINIHINDSDVTEANKIFPDTIEVLECLHNKGKKVGLVTHNGFNHLRDVFDFLHINPDFFDVVIGHDEVKRFKPDPEGILIALDKLGYDANKHSACYIGDSNNDVKAGNNANIDSIFIRRYHNKNDAHEGKYEIDNLKMLLEY